MVLTGITKNLLTLCFRELNNTKRYDEDYCPLGKLTLPIPNDYAASRKYLKLGDEAEFIPPAYPQGFELLLSASGVINTSFVTQGPYIFNQIGDAPGVAVTTDFVLLLDVGYSVTAGADCFPGFTGLECNTLVTAMDEGSSVAVGGGVIGFVFVAITFVMLLLNATLLWRSRGNDFEHHTSVLV